MYILHDIPSADLSHIQAIGTIDEGFSLFDYVRISQPNDQAWIGQIVQPNQNISTVGQRLEPTILHGLELMQQHRNVQAVQSVQVFDILVLGQLQGRQMMTPRVRPLPGAIVARLSAEETASLLELPAMQVAENDSNVLGVLLNADNVPLCIDRRKFNYHIMVSGGTGSGKSNVSANLIHQALRYGKCVIVHDAKPDYARIGQENRDDRVREVWNLFDHYRLSPVACGNVQRVGLAGCCDPNSVDLIVGFRCSDLNPEMLAGLFFVGMNEQNQFDGFASSAFGLHQRQAGGQRRPFTLDDILAEVTRRSAANPQPVPPTEQIHEMVANAIQRKVGQRRSQFPWLDAAGRPAGRPMDRLRDNRLGGQRQQVQILDIGTLAQAGRVVVIDYSQTDAATYAVVLAYALRESQRLRRNRRGPGMVQIVDEAHRIFDNESRHSGTLSMEFERVMREGRSVDHSIVLSLQNASQIPARVMNNVNSKFVMRQNSKTEADAATQTMGREFSQQSLRLGTGHALVSMHESRAVVLAHMAPSPYELMRVDTDNAPQEGGPGAAADEFDDDIPF